MFLKPTDNVFGDFVVRSSNERSRDHVGTDSGLHYYIRAEVPVHQDYFPNCIACGGDLHYSSGWARRACMDCGFIEGGADYRTYPTPYVLKEYITLLGMIYQMLKMGALDSADATDWISSITTYGNSYRPDGESEK